VAAAAAAAAAARPEQVQVVSGGTAAISTFSESLESLVSSVPANLSSYSEGRTQTTFTSEAS
jgi:hypothetical protein